MSAPGPEPPASPGPLFTRDFTLFLVCLTAVTLGLQIQAAVVGYQLYEITRDPLSLGTIGLAEAIPVLALALVGGHTADVLDRRRVAIVAIGALAVAAGALLWMSARRAALGDRALVLGIYAVIATGGVCRAFLQPARTALSADIVPRAHYPRAIAWRTGLFQLGSVVGPALGGLVYAWGGAQAAYVASASLIAAGGLAMAAVRSPRAAVERPSPGALLASVRAGLRYLWNEPLLLPAITLDLFAVLFGGAVALLPVFANDILEVGPRGFGVLRAAPAVGAVLASALLATRPPLGRAGKAMLLSVAGFGLCMIGFALSRSFLLSVFLLAASGALDMVSVLVRSALLQLRVPAGMLGRISAINQMFIGSSNEIGAFESGVAARLMGTVPSVVFGGVVTLVVVGVTAWRAPALRRLERLH